MIGVRQSTQRGIKMIVVSRKNKGITVSNIWYASEPVKSAGIHYYYESLQPIGQDITPFRTLLTDLTESEEAITARFAKNTRYEIRRAAKEGVQAEIRYGEEVSSAEVEAFCQFFHKFWESKEHPEITVETIHRQIRDYVQAKRFCITKASFEGQTMVYHTYIQGDDTIRLFQSASLFRTDSNISKSLVGMANRYLHQSDIMAFKAKGYKMLDWGGAGLEEEVASITKFKADFGGEVATYYNGMEVVGILPKLAVRLLALLH